MDISERSRAALLLAEAERLGQPIPPLTATFAGFEVSDAYEVQLINVRNRLAAGRRVAGHKVGLTALAVQRMLGVDEPDYGHLLDDMVVGNGATTPAASYLQPRVEIEIAFFLGSRLAGPGVTADDVRTATAAVAPAIEIVASRIADWKITLADTIADNASSAGYVVGPTRVPIAEVNLPSVEGTLRKNGEILDKGPGSAVLGDPAVAVAWLANKLSDFGEVLDAGEMVLPGACTKMFDVGPGDRIEGEFNGLGSVSVAFS